MLPHRTSAGQTSKKVKQKLTLLILQMFTDRIAHFENSCNQIINEADASDHDPILAFEQRRRGA